MEREIRKKKEEGYVPLKKYLTDVEVRVADKIDHSKMLPKNLSFSKPTKAPPKRYFNRSDIYFTKKVNGETVIVHKMADGTVRIYSRRIDDITEWFLHLEEFVEKESGIPNRSILLFEGFMGNGDTRRDAILASKIFRSDPPLAFSKQQKMGWMRFYLFRVPVWGGKDVEVNTMHKHQLEWLAGLPDTWRLSNRFDGQRFIYPAALFKNMSVPEALRLAQRNGWEGFVGYDPDQKFGDKSYSFHGKPDRPSSFFKAKPVKEDDFVIIWDPSKDKGGYGTGKNKDRVGYLAMYQYNKKGEKVYCGDVGTGLTDADRDRIKRVAGLGAYVGVAEVYFDDRFFISAGDNSNAVQLPRIHRLRTDKKPEECICEELS